MCIIFGSGIATIDTEKWNEMNATIDTTTTTIATMHGLISIKVKTIAIFIGGGLAQLVTSSVASTKLINAGPG